MSQTNVNVPYASVPKIDRWNSATFSTLPMSSF